MPVISGVVTQGCPTLLSLGEERLGMECYPLGSSKAECACSPFWQAMQGSPWPQDPHHLPLSAPNLGDALSDCLHPVFPAPLFLLAKLFLLGALEAF